MGIGAISGFGGISSVAAYNPNYKINSIYGNPKSLQPVEKVGEDDYSGNPFAVLSKKEEEDYGPKPAERGASFNFDAAMSRMMQGARYNAENIPLAASI